MTPPLSVVKWGCWSDLSLAWRIFLVFICFAIYQLRLSYTILPFLFQLVTFSIRESSLAKSGHHISGIGKVNLHK